MKNKRPEFGASIDIYPLETEDHLIVLALLPSLNIESDRDTESDKEPKVTSTAQS